MMCPEGSKGIAMLKEKILNQSWRIRILWGLGILIVAVVVSSMIMTSMDESNKNSGWVSYSEKNSGLANDNSAAIAIDPDDRVWIGTLEGISVFDGETWQTYSANNSGLLKPEVREIEVDPQGRVWIGLAGGVNVIDGEEWTGYTPSNSILPIAGYARAIAIDPSQRVWIGTSDGIRIIYQTTWIALREENSGLANDYVNAIAFDRNGRAWIGTNEGISVYDGQTWLSYDPGNSGVAGNAVQAIAFDPDGKAWIGTRRQGVSVFDGENWKTYKRENPGGFAGDMVEAIAIDQEGRPYILASNDLRVLDDDHWITYNAGNSGLVPYGNRDLAIDSEGRIWIASASGVSMATIDETGLPFRVSQERSSEYEKSYFTWRSLLTQVAIVSATLIWLTIFLEDIGIPLAFLITGLIWSFMTVFDIGSTYGAPLFISAGILPGGALGGIVGGVVRKLTKRGKAVSVVLTIIGAICGAFFGFAFMSFSLMGF